MSETTETFDRDQLAACQQPVRTLPGGVPIVIIPDGYSVATLESRLPAPVRKRGNTMLRDAASFVTVVNDQKSESTRLFYVDAPAPSFTAVFNDHGDIPGWGDHRARYGRASRRNGRSGLALMARK